MKLVAKVDSEDPICLINDRKIEAVQGQGPSELKGKTEIVVRPRRECLYICGASGSGKSTYASTYAKKYKKLFPQRKVFLFSKLTSDSSIDIVRPLRIRLNEKLIEDRIQPEELQKSLVIFDDIDSLRDSKMRKELYGLIDDILFTGRHFDIHIIITSHLSSNYKETRGILSECSSYTIFPSSGTNYKHLYEYYMGLTKKQIERIKQLPSRWVTIYNDYPKRVVYEDGCYLL